VSATLTITPRPDLGERVKEYVIDCPHGTTRGLAMDRRIKRATTALCGSCSPDTTPTRSAAARSSYAGETGRGVTDA
jgi:hypothetical protein